MPENQSRFGDEVDAAFADWEKALPKENEAEAPAPNRSREPLVLADEPNRWSVWSNFGLEGLH